MIQWLCCVRAKKEEDPAEVQAPNIDIEAIDPPSPLKKFLGSIGLWGRQSSFNAGFW